MGMNTTEAIAAILTSVVVGGLLVGVGTGTLTLGDDQPDVDPEDVQDGMLDITQFPVDLQFNFPDGTSDDGEIQTQLATAEPTEADFGNYEEFDHSEAEVDLIAQSAQDEDNVVYDAWDEPGIVYVAAESDGYHDQFVEYSVDEMKDERYFSEDTPVRINDFRDTMDAHPVLETGSVTVFDADGEPAAIESDHTNAAAGVEDDEAVVTHTVDEGVSYLGEVDITTPEEDAEVEIEVLVDGESVYSESVDEDTDEELTENMQTNPLRAEDDIEIVVGGMEDEEPEVMVELHNIYEEVEAELGINQS